MQHSKGHLFVISAPTGAGKTTITQKVILRLEKTVPLFKVVTYTTRPPRPQELDGIDYHFISIQDFERKLEWGDFLETTSYDGHWYGSPKDILTDLTEGKSFILVTDRAGSKTIKTLCPDAILIWLTVPSPEIIAQRLKQRGTENHEQFMSRLAIATKEMNEENTERLFDHHIMNTDLEQAMSELEAIIIKNLYS